MTSYDELERRLLYHRNGRVEEPMLRGLLQSYSCTFHETEDHGNGIAFHYYRVRAACPLPSRCRSRRSHGRRAARDRAACTGRDNAASKLQPPPASAPLAPR